MPTSTRFVLSLHMLALVADRDGAPLRSEDIAASVGTNPAFVRSILLRLSAAGLTKAQMGHRGGALLARAPEEIRLLDVYLAVEDRELFAFPRSEPGDGTPTDRHVTPALEALLVPVRGALEGALSALTLRDVIADIAARESLSD